MIQGPTPIKCGDEHTLASALSVFSTAICGLEGAGLIVREFPQANANTIWIFGYLIEAIKTASSTGQVEVRNFKNETLLGYLQQHLSRDGHVSAADAVSRMSMTAFNAVRSGEQNDAIQRRAHMRRYACLSWGVFNEMHEKGIWPAHEDIEIYRQAYEAAVIPGDCPAYTLSQDELLNDLVRQVSPYDAAAAEIIQKYKMWKTTRANRLAM